MRLLRIWLAVTGIALGVLALWALAPVLIFVVMLIVFLGVLAFAMVGIARWLRLILRARRLRSVLKRD